MKIKKYFVMALMAIACSAMFVACGDKKSEPSTDPVNSGTNGTNGTNGENQGGDSEAKCWEVTQTSPGGATNTVYVWTTYQMLINLYPAVDKSNGMQNTYKEADANDQESCQAKNNYE